MLNLESTNPKSYFKKQVCPHWHTCIPPAVWDGSRIWQLVEDFMPTHQIHPWLTLNSFPEAQSEGSGRGSQRPSPVRGDTYEPGWSLRGCTASEIYFHMKCGDEARSFLAELAAPTHGQVPLAVLMVQEWTTMVMQRQRKLIQTLVWQTKISQHIVQCT